MLTDLNVKVVQGNSLKIRFKVTDPNGSAIDFTSWEIQEILWVVKESVAAASVLEKRYSQGDITVSDGAEGQFIINITADDLSVLTGNYYHEAVIQTVAGDVYTVVEDDDMDLADFIVRQSLTI